MKGKKDKWEKKEWVIGKKSEWVKERLREKRVRDKNKEWVEKKE